VVADVLPRAAPADLLALTKPRIVGLILITVAAGYYMASAPAPIAPALVRALILAHALIGTALVAGGTNALNQVAERDLDALMRRTARRPIPAGRLTAKEGAVFAWTVGAVGVAHLAAFVNLATAALAAATLVSYAFVYTPLKRRTPLATLVGAVPGALPVAGGWAAAGGALDGRVCVLFAVLFLWQLPHFLALDWIYRDDYARAGLRTLSVSDASGVTTFTHAALGATALVPVSLAPTVLGMTGGVYFLGAFLLSGWFAWTGLRAARERSTAAARRLFAVSLAYLPGILILMAADRQS
jgi:heme o synthase